VLGGGGLEGGLAAEVLDRSIPKAVEDDKENPAGHGAAATTAILAFSAPVDYV